MRLLVVDDDTDTRELLGMVLTQYGAEVITASSAAAALDAFRHTRFDALICDIEMPEVDGYELIRQIRAIAGGESVPAIAVTAYARSEDRVRALSAGFQMHVPKPVEPAELVTVLGTVTKSFAGRSE